MYYNLYWSFTRCLLQHTEPRLTSAAAAAMFRTPSQMFAKYYMKFTDMSPDEIEQNTCRDTFMTPEQAVDAGIIDDVFASENDWVTPPAVYRQLEEAGLIDRLSGGILAPSTRI